MAQPSVVITLAGVEYPVQKLAVRQLRVVVPALVSLIGELGPLIKSAMEAKTGGNSLDFLSALNLTEDQFDLAIRAVHTTIQRGTPTLTMDAFMALEFDALELFMALPIVMQMTGLMPAPGVVEAVAAEPVPGEEQPPQSK